MNHKELDYKDKFMKSRLLEGDWIESVETNRPGFPDALYDNGTRLFFLEFKWFELGETQGQTRDFFTDYQLPWMLRYVGVRTVDNLAVVWGYPRGGWVFWVRTRADVKFLLNSKLIDVIRKSTPWERKEKA